MKVKNLEKEMIRILDKKLKVKHNKERTILYLIEEINKLKIRNKKTNKENLKDEIGENLILLTKLANNYNIGIEDAIKDKINKLKIRHKLE